MTDFFSIVSEITLPYSQMIDNNRTADSIRNHMIGEMAEVSEEIFKAMNGDQPGKDGIVGEVIDVMVCIVDYRYVTDDPVAYNNVVDMMLTFVSDADLDFVRNYTKIKCDKWKAVYG